LPRNANARVSPRAQTRGLSAVSFKAIHQEYVRLVAGMVLRKS
jgi:hypothetical protein